MNKIDQWLIEFCAFHNQCITNTDFLTHGFLVVSTFEALAPAGPDLHQVVFIHSYQSADCDTDYSLVCFRARMKLNKFHRARQQGKAHICMRKMPKAELAEKIAVTFERELGILQSRVSATQIWQELRSHSPTFRFHDWFEAKLFEMILITADKRAALSEHKKTPNEKILQTLTTARINVQQISGCCANEYRI